MGWTGVYRSVKNYREGFENVIKTDFSDCNFIDYSIKGSVAYAVMSNKKDDKETRFICVFLMQKKKNEFMYKDMDESCGPYYYDCPAKFLKLVEGYEPVNDISRKYREKVKLVLEEKAKNRKKTLNIIENTVVMGRPTFVLEEKTINGINYKLGKMNRLKAGYVLLDKYNDIASRNRYYSLEQAWKSITN